MAREVEIVGQAVAGAQGNDAQGNALADQCRQGFVHGAVAAADDDGVAAALNSLARLEGAAAGLARGLQQGFNAGGGKGSRGRLDIAEAAGAAASGFRVIEQESFAQRP
jgi:hypothetical protein